MQGLLESTLSKVWLKFFMQGPVDQLAGFEQGLGGAWNILGKVRLKNFMQGLVEFIRESMGAGNDYRSFCWCQQIDLPPPGRKLREEGVPDTLTIRILRREWWWRGGLGGLLSGGGVNGRPPPIDWKLGGHFYNVDLKNYKNQS